MYYTVVLTIHVILAIVLVILVLLQQGKGADAGAVMGGGANTVFGVGGGASMLVKLTTTIAVLFMLTSVGLVKLSMMEGGRGRSAGDAVAGSVMGSVSQPESAKPQQGLPTNPEQKTEAQPAAPVDGVANSK